MAGSRGPVPEHSSRRRRRNKDGGEVEAAPAGSSVPSVAPEADASWHPIALQWYESLAVSGQSSFYEASDWAMAYLGAQLMSKLCRSSKPSAQMFAAILSLTSSLLATEGDRRRLRLELARVQPVDEDEEAADATVTDLRSRLGG